MVSYSGKTIMVLPLFFCFEMVSGQPAPGSFFKNHLFLLA